MRAFGAAASVLALVNLDASAPPPLPCVGMLDLFIILDERSPQARNLYRGTWLKWLQVPGRPPPAAPPTSRP